MPSSNPSALATWLLRRFGQSSESFEGDLLEQYRQRRSALWYWRQVLIAVVMGNWEQIRQQKLAAARSVVVGLLLMAVGGPTVAVLSDLTDPFAVWIANWLLENDLPFLRFWWFRLEGYDLVPTMMVCTGLFLIGWIVVRIHPRKSVAPVLLLCAVVLLITVPMITSSVVDLANVPQGHWALFVHLVLQLLFLSFTQPLSILAGGIAGVRR